MSEKFSEFRELAALFSEPIVLQILEVLYTQGECTATDMANILHIHIATAKKYLEKLAEKGIVRKESKRKHIRKTEVYALAKKHIHLHLDLDVLAYDEEALATFANNLRDTFTRMFNQTLNTSTENPYEVLNQIKSSVGATGAEVVFKHAVKNLDASTVEYLTKKEVLKKMEDLIKCNV